LLVIALFSHVLVQGVYLSKIYFNCLIRCLVKKARHCITYVEECL